MTELLILRPLHILGAIFWVGSTVFLTLFLGPALAPLGATSGQVMLALQRRGLIIFMPLVSIVTLVSGGWLLYLRFWKFGAASLATPAGFAYSAAGAAAVVAFLVGLIVTRPTVAQIAKLQLEGGGSIVVTPEIDRLNRRLNQAAYVTTALLLLASLGMAIARYV